MLAAGDVRPKCKQVTQQNISGELANYAPLVRKSKLWMEIPDLQHELYEKLS